MNAPATTVNTPMVDHALALARRGFWVFPLTPGSKEPPLIHGFQSDGGATRDPAKIARWWKKWPDANIGISTSRFGTGEALVVVDVDNKGDRRGSTTLALLEIVQGLELSPTLTIKTPSGGFHYFYRTPVAVKQGVDVLGDGLDIRSNGGYVVAAGSVVPAGAYAVETDAPIAECPQWVTDRCGFEKARSVEPPREGVNPALAADRAREYLASIQVVTTGSRNDAGFKAAARLRDFGVAHVDAADILREHWKCEPPLEDAELQHVVDSAYRYARGQAGSKAPEADLDDLAAYSATSEEVAASPGDADSGGLRLCWDEPGTRSPALRLIKGMLRENGKSLWVGKPDAGKTTVVLDAGLHIAHGLPWMGRKTTQGGVLLVAFERSDDVQGRLDAFYLEHPEIKRGAPFAYVIVEGRTLAHGGTAAAIVKAAQAMAEKSGPVRLVIIDTLSAGLKGDENESAAVGEFFRAADYIKNATGAHIACLHHPGKDASKGPRGSSKLTGDIDATFVLEDGCITSEKLKAVKGGPIFYSTHVVTLGHDEDGDAITSVAMRPASGRTLKANTPADNALRLLSQCPPHPAPEHMQRQGINEVVHRAEWVTLVQGAMAADRRAQGRPEPSARGSRNTAANSIRKLLEKKPPGVRHNKHYVWSSGDADSVMLWPSVEGAKCPENKAASGFPSFPAGAGATSNPLDVACSKNRQPKGAGHQRHQPTSSKSKSRKALSGAGLRAADINDISDIP